MAAEGAPLDGGQGEQTIFKQKGRNLIQLHGDFFFVCKTGDPQTADQRRAILVPKADENCWTMTNSADWFAGSCA